VCPVGAIHPDKPFDFNACMTHNYRDFMGGFEDWVQNIVSSKTVKEYKEKVPSDESISKWQSLSFGAQYKSAYCMAVCPAGEDLIGIYKEHRKEWVEQIVRPQKEKKEPVFVQQGTNAEEHARLNKNKEVRLVDNIIRPQSISGFLTGARITFEAKRAQSVNMTVHLAFTGKEARTATIVIKEGTIEVTDGLKEKADLRIECDSEQWLKIINKEISNFDVLKLLVTRRMRIKGNRKLLRKFQHVFVIKKLSTSIFVSSYCFEDSIRRYTEYSLKKLRKTLLLCLNYTFTLTSAVIFFYQILTFNIHTRLPISLFKT